MNHDSANAPTYPVTFAIRHTSSASFYLNHDEFMLYNTNCHTVVDVSVYGDTNADHKYIFNPRIIRKFCCVREVYITNVRFLHSTFTVPKTARTIIIRNCTKLTTLTTNQNLTAIFIHNCPDLTNIGPTIKNTCDITIENCQRLKQLPHHYVTPFIDSRDKLNIYLTNTPQIDLSTLPPIITSLYFDGSELTCEQTTFPIVTCILQLAPILMNIICESTGTIPKSPYYGVYTMQSSTTMISATAMEILIHQVMTRDVNVVVDSYSSNTNVQVIINHIKGIANNCANNNEISYSHILDMLFVICPKYIEPVKSIKFNQSLSMYESIILAAVPRFYSCLVACKDAEPTKFSAFCNKMRDAMRHR